VSEWIVVVVSLAALPQKVGVADLCGGADDGVMTSTAENKTVVDEFIQALFTKGDLLAVDRYPADDFVAHDPPVAGLSGEAAGFRDAAATLRAAFPDFTEHAEVGALKLLLASDCMLIPGRKDCRYREQR
jgi:hypothetical protein